MIKKTYETNVEPGEFPFKIISGPRESRYLTWLRNHANYMAVRGFLDYLRAIGVLLRGIIINFMVLLPIFLGVAILVALWYLVVDPFLLTTIALVLAAITVLLFPLLTPLFKILRHRRRLATGSDSSVKPRSGLERVFGALLLTILGVAAFESLPYFLDDFHRFVYEGNLGWPTLVSVMSVAASVFAAADKMLKALGGLARKLAMLVVGAFGVLVPLLFILWVADFLVFNPPSWSFSTQMAILTVPALMVLVGLGAYLMIVFGWVAGLTRVLSRAFTWGDVVKSNLLLLLAVVAIGGTFYGLEKLDWKSWSFDAKLDQALISLTNPDNYTNPELTLFQSFAQGWMREVLNPPRQGLDEQTAWKKYTSAIDDLDMLYEDVSEAPYPRRLGRLYDELKIAHWDLRPLLSDSDGNASTSRGTYDTDLRGLREKVSKVPLARLFAAEDPGQLAIILIEGRDFADGDDEGGDDEDGDVEDGDVQDGDVSVGIDEELGVDRFEALMNVSGAEISDPRVRQMAWTLSRLGSDIRAARTELSVIALYSKNDYPNIYKTSAARGLHMDGFIFNLIMLGLFAVPLWILTRFTVDVNLTSIHGLYRDRLASAFLVGVDTQGDVDIEQDLDLGEICRHEAGSRAPYHLINAALNMQGSKAMGVKDRQSDFLVFSKKFIGGFRTGYCRAETMELYFPQMSLATAMAISAAAASPNMGRATSPALVAIMTLLNIRLGFWMPNPGRLESWVAHQKGNGGKQDGYRFGEVFREELEQVTRRWGQLPQGDHRHLSADENHRSQPTTRHGLVGIAFSGGGIRSATVNLGITQALHQRGVFDHVDYMSTVSGGGYLGSSISTLMRRISKTESDITGIVSIDKQDPDRTVVRVTPKKSRLTSRLLGPAGEPREYRFASYADIAVTDRQKVRAGQRLLSTGLGTGTRQKSFSAYYRWRVRTSALLREILGRLDESHRWVNVSDGGHIENLATIELLRRRCKYIIIGDAEADPNHSFGGLATLIRTARIDLGIHIDLHVDALRIEQKGKRKGFCKHHWAVGKIHYPDLKKGEKVPPGYLLYLKSSVTGDEDEVVQQYRNSSPSFPHESTADQFFTEGQFEAYRGLGQHIAEKLFEETSAPGSTADMMSFADFENWFQSLGEKTSDPNDDSSHAR